MDNNDSNIKPQQTGGLKLMTVFIAVLVLHVLVIGGITVYHLMSGSSSDADLAATDKTHRSLTGSATADGTLPDATQGDKSGTGTTTATTPTEVATIPVNPTTPTTDATAPAVATAAATTPASTAATTVTTPQASSQPITSATPSGAVEQTAQTPTGPSSPELAPPAEPSIAPVTPAPYYSAPAPTAEIASGPVHMPPAVTAAPASQATYVVKITDSYYKIAHRHHVTVAALKEANNIHGDVLHTGQKLIIPSSGKIVAASAPTPAATALDAAASGPGPDISAPAPSTSLASSSPTVSTTGLKHEFYTVVKGDTLVRIARRFGTTATALMNVNGITDPTKLSIGKKLRIPSEESRSVGNNAPASTQPSQVQAKETGPTAQLANYVH